MTELNNGKAMSGDVDTMSDWNWFKHKLRKRLFRKYTLEAEDYWKFITNPCYADTVQELKEMKERISKTTEHSERKAVD